LLDSPERTEATFRFSWLLANGSLPVIAEMHGPNAPPQCTSNTAAMLYRPKSINACNVPESNYKCAFQHAVHRAEPLDWLDIMGKGDEWAVGEDEIIGRRSVRSKP